MKLVETPLLIVFLLSLGGLSFSQEKETKVLVQSDAEKALQVPPAEPKLRGLTRGGTRSGGEAPVPATVKIRGWRSAIDRGPMVKRARPASAVPHSLEGAEKEISQDAELEVYAEVNLELPVLFEFGKEIVLQDEVSQRNIGTLAEILKKDPQLKIALVGETCDIGTLEGNSLLSLNRANAIRSRLVNEHRVPVAQVESLGCGPSNVPDEVKALSQKRTPENEAQRAPYRRVSIRRVVN